MDIWNNSSNFARRIMGFDYYNTEIQLLKGASSSLVFRSTKKQSKGLLFSLCKMMSRPKRPQYSPFRGRGTSAGHAGRKRAYCCPPNPSCRCRCKTSSQSREYHARHRQHHAHQPRILHRHRPTNACGLRVLVVGNGTTILSRQMFFIGLLHIPEIVPSVLK